MTMCQLIIRNSNNRNSLKPSKLTGKTNFIITYEGNVVVSMEYFI